MKTISCGSRYISSEMHSSFTGCAQCLAGLVVSACATTQQQWGLMFPSPFLGPIATERWGKQPSCRLLLWAWPAS